MIRVDPLQVVRESVITSASLLGTRRSVSFGVINGPSTSTSCCADSYLSVTYLRLRAGRLPRRAAPRHGAALLLRVDLLGTTLVTPSPFDCCETLQSQVPRAASDTQDFRNRPRGHDVDPSLTLGVRMKSLAVILGDRLDDGLDVWNDEVERDGIVGC